MAVYFISQPMKGRQAEEIKEERETAVTLIKGGDPEAEILDTLFGEGMQMGGWNMPLLYLSMSIRELAKADYAVFVGRWKEARGCRIEHICAEEYEIKVLEWGQE